MNPKLKEKIGESLSAVLPITAIVFLLCITITPIPAALLMLFFAGAFLLVIGMGFFTLGADMAMMPIGEQVGVQLAKSKKIPFIALCCFVIGAVITIAEPDLQVLAGQVPGVPNMVLIFAVAGGVGIFLVLAFLRSLFGWSLSAMLIICYAIVFAATAFIPKSFIAMAFDSGGVTTGPMTVPFIMALGLGLATIGKNQNEGGDSFGLVALCSIGPIISVLILGLVYGSDGGAYTPLDIPSVETTRDLAVIFGEKLPEYVKEVFTAIFPIVIFFGVFQIFFLKMRRRQLAKILIGLVYTLIGLTLFLTGVNVGFMPVGNYLGSELAKLDYNYIMIPLGMLIGYFIVKAEPAVIVLNKQVEDITQGAISQKTMMTGLSVGMAVSVGISMLRVLTGIPILWFLIPGYAIALGLSFVTPKIFTSIAFDSGGVASGPMTATFLLPFAMGACEALGGNILTDAFGIVAMVAMTPLIIIQIIGVLYKVKTTAKKQTPQISDTELENEVIELSLEEEGN